MNKTVVASVVTLATLILVAMQTHNVTIMLPDIIEFDDRAALQMQVIYLKSLVDAGKIDFNDEAQRNAVLEWYLQVAPHIQPTAQEHEAAKAELWQQLGWPTAEPGETLDELRQAIRADLARLDGTSSDDAVRAQAQAAILEAGPKRKIPLMPRQSAA